MEQRGISGSSTDLLADTTMSLHPEYSAHLHTRGAGVDYTNIRGQINACLCGGRGQMCSFLFNKS